MWNNSVLIRDMWYYYSLESPINMLLSMLEIISVKIMVLWDMMPYIVINKHKEFR
jgi:hypothetical protein